MRLLLRRTPFAAAVAAAAFLVLALTASRIPIGWDEGEYLWRADQVLSWCGLLLRPQGGGGLAALSADTIRQYWHFVTWEEGHPAWGAYPIALTTALFGRTGIAQTLTAARLGPMLVFGAACGVVAYRLRERYGIVAGLSTPVALLTFPRLFAEAHFATLDGQLTAWWLLLWAIDASSSGSYRLSVVSGIAGGLTAATKFPGVLAAVPATLSRLISGPNRRRLGLFIALPVAVATFILVNPPTWHDPIGTITTHVHLNTARTLNVPVVFLGERYDLSHSLPWYNTLVWLLVVTPVPLLVLGAVGVVHAVRTRESAAVALVLHWATLMIVRALPGAPPHDGIRLFLPAFGFWCVLAGLGAQRTWDIAALSPRRRALVIRAALVAGLASGAVTVMRYYPQTLSHYNFVVGGVRGAAALGFEPTYWWDSLDRDVLAWLNDHTGPGDRVAFSSIANIGMIRGWGWLTPERADRRGTFKWYVFQNRTSFLADSDRYLMERVPPAYVRFAGGHTADDVPPDLDVPLLYIYSYEQYQAAQAAVAREH